MHKKPEGKTLFSSRILARNVGRHLLLALLLVPFPGIPALSADTHTAASAALADVQAAVNAASPGDQVIIPAGNVAWTAKLTITKSLTLTGNGIGSTVITNNAADGIAFTLDAAETCTVGGIEFVTNRGNSLVIGGGTKSFRVHHCKFTNTAAANHICLGIGGLNDAEHSYGVIDNCAFTDARINIRGGGQGDRSWTEDTGLGTASAVYIEDCSFSRPNHTFGNCIDNDSGARYVARYNIVTDSTFLAHGLQDGDSSGFMRGGRKLEAYHNIFKGVASENNFDGIGIDGGTAIVFANSVTNVSGDSYNFVSSLASRRVYSDGNYLPGLAKCDGGNIIDGNEPVANGTGTHAGGNDAATLACTGKTWTAGAFIGMYVYNLTDGSKGKISNNGSTTVTATLAGGTDNHWDTGDSFKITNGYPAHDQLGRGKDADTIARTYPPYDASDLPQALEPVYLWGNTIDGANSAPHVPSNCASHIKADRDFYDYKASFNGTSGVGVGPLSSRPATCTKGVGYWATDQNILYVASATNTWKAYYQPYAYPHPLRSQTLTVVSPNGGESWAAGSSRNITWTSGGGTSNVKLEYSVNNGSAWTTIVASASNTGTYPWTLPGVSSGSCLVRVSAAGTGSPADVSDAVFSITSVAPLIGLSRTSLNFGADRNGAPTPAANVLITNAGVGTLNWTAAAYTDWISVTPGSGTGSGTLTIGITRTNMPPGTYQGTVTVSDPGAANSPRTILINLKVAPDGADAPPFGDFGTPLDGANVASSIPVTGWTLDDISVESVKIYRGTGLSDRIFIGDAVFVQGARPDVETAFPTYPQNDRAGWGYMLLTNFLPNGGNGTFQLLAYAVDSSGHEALIGRKTIHADNLNAVLPFGAIDTPTQGGTASGSSFLNFAWALTPMPKSIPVDGSTITVMVDGVPIGHPLYGYLREDIAGIFPGYANSAHSTGVFTLDTTEYVNGIHTIAWIVTDSAGAVDGIGSRYFTIQNTSGGSSSDPEQTDVRPVSELALVPDDIRTPVFIKHGYGPRVPIEIAYPEPEGTIRVRIPELSTIAVYLSEVEESEPITRDILRDRQRRSAGRAPSGASASFEGYELVGDTLRPLPLGASFDPEAGVFYWQPGLGFSGEFTFIFVLNGETGRVKKTLIVNVDHR